MATMGERIKQLRKENGWTQTELAEKMGVTKGTVSTWETDSRRPAFETLDQLCDLFDRSMGYVTGQSDIPGHSRMTQEEAIDVVLSVEEEELSEYAQKYARLDEFGRKAVQAIIREEAERCRAQGTLGSSKTYSAFIHISRKNYSQE
ncbi:MAG: helix-turn-helix transcriptional regulator [Oscillospiraceae bacterium]|nr:helix-turn-helix transcriptional regulator [Oscillospiraceae bacterium]